MVSHRPGWPPDHSFSVSKCWCHRGAPRAKFYSVLGTNAGVLCILGIPEGFVVVVAVKKNNDQNQRSYTASLPRHLLASLPPFTLSLALGLGTVTLAGLKLVPLLSRPHNVGVPGVCT